jgi:hypothetical protein
VTTQQSQIRALLKLGESRKDIAERLKCTYDAVSKEAQKLKKEEDGDVTKVDADLLNHVIAETKETAPAEIVKKFEVIEEGITGLQKLDDRFHKSMTKMLDKADSFLVKDISVSEFATVTGAISNAYKSIFQSGGVNVNVNNGTQISDTKLSMFKGALRG